MGKLWVPGANIGILEFLGTECVNYRPRFGFTLPIATVGHLWKNPWCPFCAPFTQREDGRRGGDKVINNASGWSLLFFSDMPAVIGVAGLYTSPHLEGNHFNFLSEETPTLLTWFFEWFLVVICLPKILDMSNRHRQTQKFDECNGLLWQIRPTWWFHQRHP